MMIELVQIGEIRRSKDQDVAAPEELTDFLAAVLDEASSGSLPLIEPAAATDGAGVAVPPVFGMIVAGPSHHHSAHALEPKHGQDGIVSGLSTSLPGSTDRVADLALQASLLASIAPSKGALDPFPAASFQPADPLNTASGWPSRFGLEESRSADSSRAKDPPVQLSESIGRDASVKATLNNGAPAPTELGTQSEASVDASLFAPVPEPKQISAAAQSQDTADNLTDEGKREGENVLTALTDRSNPFDRSVLASEGRKKNESNDRTVAIATVEDAPNEAIFAPLLSDAAEVANASITADPLAKSASYQAFVRPDQSDGPETHLIAPILEDLTLRSLLIRTREDHAPAQGFPSSRHTAYSLRLTEFGQNTDPAPLPAERTTAIPADETPEPGLDIATATDAEHSLHTDTLDSAHETLAYQTDAEAFAPPVAVFAERVVPLPGAGVDEALGALSTQVQVQGNLNAENAAAVSSGPGSGGQRAIDPLPTQIVQRIVERAEDRAELLLEPAELGRVRFEITHHGDGIRVLLSAERPETLELMRRNLEQLASELRTMGFASADLGFGSWSNKQAKPGPDLHADYASGPEADFPEFSTPLQSRPLTAGSGSLDLRL